MDKQKVAKMHENKTNIFQDKEKHKNNRLSNKVHKQITNEIVSDPTPLFPTSPAEHVSDAKVAARKNNL